MAADLAFQALADPVRREILGVLASREECSAGEIAERIRQVGRTAVSTHLRILRTAGLVHERRDGRFRYYSLDQNGPAQVVLGFLEGLFREPLEELESTMAANPARPRELQRTAS